MTMLDANDPAFQEHYPNGATVRDQLGRKLSNVIACNPETGEVIRFASSRIPDWDPPDGKRISPSHLMQQPGIFYPVAIDGRLFRRHGFWPAPLTITPKRK